MHGPGNIPGGVPKAELGAEPRVAPRMGLAAAGPAAAVLVLVQPG